MDFFICEICDKAIDEIMGDYQIMVCDSCLEFPGQDALHFFLKNKGGDPRNHTWREVSKEKYLIADQDSFFKRVAI